MRRAFVRTSGAGCDRRSALLDLLAPQNSATRERPHRQKSSLAGSIARRLCSAADNETVLKRAAGPQILPVYGTDFRSIPGFFMQDHRDDFDKDAAGELIRPSHTPNCSRRIRSSRLCPGSNSMRMATLCPMRTSTERTARTSW